MSNQQMKKDSTLNQAIALHQAGRFPEAETAYRTLLEGRPDDVNLLYLLGTVLLQQNRLDEGASMLADVIRRNPAHAEALNNYGLALIEKNQTDQALVVFERAVATKPDYADAIKNLGLLRLKNGDTQEAIRALSRFLELGHKSADVYANLAEAYRSAADYQRAIPLYQNALSLKPGNALILQRLAQVCNATGARDAAIDYYVQSIKLNPGIASAYTELADILLGCNRTAELQNIVTLALRSNLNDMKFLLELGGVFRAKSLNNYAANFVAQAVKLDPENWRLRLELAQILMSLKSYDLADKELDRVIALHSACAEAYEQKANVAYLREDYDKSVTLYDRAIQIGPAAGSFYNGKGAALLHIGGAEAFRQACEAFRLAEQTGPVTDAILNSLGHVCRIQGLLYKATKYFERAIELNPNCGPAQMNLGLCYLSTGKIKEGWEKYEWRWQSGRQHERAIPYPTWKGEDLAGKTIIVYAEQGLGDEILFASCIPDLMQTAGHCVIECDPRLVTIFERSFPGATIVERRDVGMPVVKSEIRHIDFKVAAGSLPLFFRQELQDFNNTAPGYLSADPEKVTRWKKKHARRDDTLRIGISWKSSVETGMNRSAGLSREYLRELLQLEGMDFHNLQYGDISDLTSLVEEEQLLTFRVYDIDYKNDLEEVIALIESLDLVIAVPNSVSTLAGALGKPCLRLNSPDVESEPFRLGQSNYPWFRNTRNVEYYQEKRIFIELIKLRWLLDLIQQGIPEDMAAKPDSDTDGFYEHVVRARLARPGENADFQRILPLVENITRPKNGHMKNLIEWKQALDDNRLSKNFDLLELEAAVTAQDRHFLLATAGEIANVTDSGDIHRKIFLDYITEQIIYRGMSEDGRFYENYLKSDNAGMYLSDWIAAKTKTNYTEIYLPRGTLKGLGLNSLFALGNINTGWRTLQALYRNAGFTTARGGENIHAAEWHGEDLHNRNVAVYFYDKDELWCWYTLAFRHLESVVGTLYFHPYAGFEGRFRELWGANSIPGGDDYEGEKYNLDYKINAQDLYIFGKNFIDNAKPGSLSTRSLRTRPKTGKRTVGIFLDNLDPRKSGYDSIVDELLHSVDNAFVPKTDYILFSDNSESTRLLDEVRKRNNISIRQVKIGNFAASEAVGNIEKVDLLISTPHRTFYPLLIALNMPIFNLSTLYLQNLLYGLFYKGQGCKWSEQFKHYLAGMDSFSTIGRDTNLFFERILNDEVSK